jgi:hypothetical protein
MGIPLFAIATLDAAPALTGAAPNFINHKGNELKRLISP